MQTSLDALEPQKVDLSRGIETEGKGKQKGLKGESFAAMLQSACCVSAGDRDSNGNKEKRETLGEHGEGGPGGEPLANGDQSSARHHNPLISRGKVAGNSTAGRHEAGGFDDFDGRSSQGQNGTGAQDEGKPDATDGAGSQGREKKKSNNNNEMIAQGADLGTRIKMPIHSSFEQAGLPRHELERLVRVLHGSQVAGQSQISVTVRTQELGEIAFHVRIEAKQVYIHAFVESEKAAGALALAIGELGERLRNVGLALARFDVTTGKDRQLEGRPRSGKSRKRDQDAPSARSGAKRKRARARGKNKNGVLHVLA